MRRTRTRTPSFESLPSRIAPGSFMVGGAMIPSTSPESSPVASVPVQTLDPSGNPTTIYENPNLTMPVPTSPISSPVRTVPTDTSVPADLQTPSPFGGHSMLV